MRTSLRSWNSRRDGPNPGGASPGGGIHGTGHRIYRRHGAGEPGRALSAAEAKRQAGAFDSALGLADVAQRGPLDDSQRVELDVLRAQISFASQRGNEAPPLLLQAAHRLEPLDPSRARETYLDALTAALFAGRQSKGANTVEIAKAARTAPQPLTGHPGLRIFCSTGWLC